MSPWPLLPRHFYPIFGARPVTGVSTFLRVMAAPVFSPLVPRWCGWCQQPLQGRSDKRFCSAGCRNMAARHGEVAGGPVDAQARAEQQAVAELEERYDLFPRLFTQVVSELKEGTLAGVLAYVERLLGDYAQHPGLAQGEAGPRARLENLQILQAVIRARQAVLPALAPVEPSESRPALS